MPDNTDESAIVTRAMQRLSDHLSDGPGPLASAMWWRLNLRRRRLQAQRAQAPLIWMSRISQATVALAVAGLIIAMPNSQPAAEAGLLMLGALAIPVAITLWGWSRSKN